MTPEREKWLIAIYSKIAPLYPTITFGAILRCMDEASAEQERETWQAALTEAARLCDARLDPKEQPNDKAVAFVEGQRWAKRDILALRDRGPKP